MIYNKLNYSYLIEISETIKMSWKMNSGLFKNVINKMCLEILFLMNVYKRNLALNSL